MFAPRPAIAVFVVVGSLLASLVLGATARADSIVYVKGGDVWLSSPDGARQYQVTFDGGYSSPSQADDGTVLALQGKHFVRMDRSGRRIGQPIAGMGTPPVPANNLYGPWEPRISPDGKRIAYSFGSYTSYYSPPCNCNLWRIEDQTAWSWSDRFTDPSTQLDYSKGITQPEWLTNDRVLAGYPDFWMSGWTWKIGTGTGYTGDSAQWWYQFTDQQGMSFYPGDPALSPDGTKLALTNGSDPSTQPELLLAAVPGPAWAGEPPYTNDYAGTSAVQQPELRCRGSFGAVVNPSWSPDSGHLALGLPDGIHVYDVPAGIPCDGIADRLLAAGGGEPDWGPADVDLAQRPSPPSTPSGPAGGTPAGGTPSAGTPAGGTPASSGALLQGVRLAPAGFRAARRGPAIAAAAGTTLRFRLAAPANLVLTVRRAGGRAVPGAIRTAGRPGAGSLRFMGRIAGRALRPGRYRLTVAAAALDGSARGRVTVAFRVVG